MTIHRGQQPTAEELSTIDLFTGLTESQISALCKTVTRVQLEKNDTLFTMGEPATSFYYLKNGQLKVIRHDLAGKEKVLAIIYPEDVFAEAAFFLPEKRYPATAICLKKTELIKFENQSFVELIGESPELAYRIITNLSMKLKRFVTQIDNLSMQNAEMRVLGFVINKLQENPESLNSRSIKLDVSKNVLASQLSMTPETFSRTLRQLHDQKVLDIRGKLIRVTDLHFLMNMYANQGTL